MNDIVIKHSNTPTSNTHNNDDSDTSNRGAQGSEGGTKWLETLIEL